MRRLPFFWLSFWLATCTLAAQTAGKVVSVQGRAEVRKGNAAVWLPTSVNQMLDAGDTIRTLAQSRAVVLLSDETQLKLNANTTLELRTVRQSSSLITRVVQASVAQGDQSLLNMATGQVWLRSKLQPANVRINTPAVTAAIRGTEFDLKVAVDGESILTMLEGAVDFRNDQGALLVASGEQARARIGQAPTKTVLLRPRDAVQWILYYPGAVSPADYPYLNQTPDRLRATIAAAQSRRAAAPADAANLLLLARAQHDLGMRQESEQSLKSLLAAMPGDREALTDLGWIYLETGRTREAIETLERVTPPTDRSRTATAMALYRQGDFQPFLETIQKVDPGTSSLGATQRAFGELMYGNADEARRLLAAIPAADAGFSLAQGLLSNVLLAQNSRDEALEAAQRAVQSGPRSPSAHLNLSLVMQSFFRIPDALQAAERALELDPAYVAAQVQVAKLQFSMGNTHRAERIARDGLTRDSSEAALNSLMGFILLAQAKTAEAVPFFEKSIARDSTRGEPYLGLGISAMRQGRLMDATQLILTASTLEPQISMYQSYLGKAFYDLRRFEMALGALENAKGLDDKDPTPYLYSGIFYNDLSRPAVAVRELTRSIELNNNRAVYRSRFLLDEDRATRNVNLASAYNRLYLSEWGNFEALKSQMADPSSSSTHIFLAQTFLNLRGRTQAAGSEQLLARLLLPVNANSFNSFNDYTTLYESPHARWTTIGQFGTFGSRTATMVASGGTQRFAYGVNGTYFQTDGFRLRNDDRRSYDGIAQFKYALTPHSDLLVLYSHGQQNAGDVAPAIIGEVHHEFRRQFTRRHRAEIGYHLQLRPGSDFVAYFSGQKLETIADDPSYFPNLFGIGLRGGLRSARRNPDLNLQASHIFKAGLMTMRYGLDILEGRARDRRTKPCCLPEFDTDYGEVVETQDVRFKNAYVHADYAVLSRLTLTGALHYDWANDNSYDNAPEDPSKAIHKWNPQAGFIFSPSDSTMLRFAFIRSLQTHIRERIAPTNIDGFVVNQNDPRLSENESYNFGWDQRLLKNSFFRASAFYRDRRTPVLDPDQDFQPTLTLNHFHGASFVWNQLLGERWSLVPEYNVIRAEDIGGIRHEHTASLRLFYISPRRYWVSLGENYVRQGALSGSRLVRGNFGTTDANVAYELPRKRGLISLSVTNIFDHRFTLLVDPLALDPRVPRRQISGTIRFNF